MDQVQCGICLRQIHDANEETQYSLELVALMTTNIRYVFFFPMTVENYRHCADDDYKRIILCVLRHFDLM